MHACGTALVAADRIRSTSLGSGGTFSVFLHLLRLRCSLSSMREEGLSPYPSPRTFCRSVSGTSSDLED